MNIKDFKSMTLEESGLITPPKFVDFDTLPNKVDEVIETLETDKLILVNDKNDSIVGILSWKDIVKIASSRPWNEIVTYWVKVHFVHPNDTVDSCLKKMQKTGHRAFPVVDENKPIGILKSRDIRNKLMHNIDITF